MSRTKTEVVADQLRDEILTGRYQAGDRMPSERELVDRLGIHRGAVREGLRAVEQLGLLEITASGPRARPLHEANLDIVGSLLALDDPPEPELVAQLLEVHAGLSSMAVRLAVERADDDVIERGRELLRRIKTVRTGEAYDETMQELIQLAVSGCGNIVLQLVRNGLEVRFWSRLLELGVTVRPPQNAVVLFVRELDRALRDRDSEGAAQLVCDLLCAQRATAVDRLKKLHAG